MVRGAGSAGAAAELAPALPAMLSGMLRVQPGGRPAAAAPDWLAPVAADAAALFRNPPAAAAAAAAAAPGDAADDEDAAEASDAETDVVEDGESAALAKAVLGAARLPAQQAALAGRPCQTSL